MKCVYESYYTKIQANEIRITASNEDAYIQSDGRFDFDINQYEDESFEKTFDFNKATKTGDDLFFLLTIQNPVAGLSFTIKGQFNLNHLFFILRRLLCT